MFSNPRGSYYSMSWQAVRESASLPKEVKDVLAMFVHGMGGQRPRLHDDSVQANTAMGRVGSGEMSPISHVFRDHVQTFAPALAICDRLTGHVD
jgi:hypothetical protein